MGDLGKGRRITGDERGALAAARQRWVGNEHAPGESDDPCNRLCFGREEPLEGDFEPTALAVYGPLFDHCERLPW